MSYRQYDFFEPSGPGKTMRGHPPADTQSIRLANAGTLFVSVQRSDGAAELHLLMDISEGHKARLSRSAILFSCAPEPQMPITLTAPPASFVRDGTSNAGFGGGTIIGVAIQPTDNLLGFGHVSNNNGHHDVSYGRYEFVAALPACQQPSFAVQVPPIEVDDSLVEVQPIAFRRRAGRYFDSRPFMSTTPNYRIERTREA